MSVLYLNSQIREEKFILLFNETYYPYFKSYSASDVLEQLKYFYYMNYSFLCHRNE